jgi:hypothetical protein
MRAACVLIGVSTLKYPFQFQDYLDALYFDIACMNHNARRPSA